MSELIPAHPRSPGLVLKRELETRGWSQKDLAQILGRPAQVITEIVRGTKQITPDTALELAAALGTSARFWTSLETEYRLCLAQSRRSTGSVIERRAKIFELLPVSELVRRGWIKGSRDVDELQQQVFAFLRVSSLEEEPRLAASYRRSTDSEDVAAAQRAWLRRVEILADAQRITTKFSVSKFRSAIPSLRAMAAQTEGVAMVPEFLAEHGVRFVVVRHLPKTKVDGAAMYAANHPIVALTLRYDRIDWFWFTLMHEVAHVALGHKRGHLDFLDERTTDDEDEAAANDFASDALLSTDAVASFAHSQSGLISRLAVEKFAQQQGIHPGVVVGRLHFLGLIPYSHFRGTLEKVGDYLGRWIDPVT
jgi:HTH-type transcriptional regulator / antitoxin HigA